MIYLKQLFGRSMKRVFAAACVMAAIAPTPSHAQSQTQTQSIGILAGFPGSTTAKLGEELARSLDGWSGVRVRTMVGKGSQHNVDDLLYLRGVDLAFINSDVMTNLRITKPDHPALKFIAYIAKVTESELHLVVQGESDIQSIFDLAGRRVAIGGPGSGTALTSRLMMRLLGIRSTAIFMDKALSLEALKNAEVDAVFMLGAKPLPILENVRAEDDLRLVGIDHPFEDGDQEVYTDAEFVSTDYPNLVQDKILPTIGVPIVLAAYDRFSRSSARYKNIVTFTAAFLETVPRLQQPPRHPKWRQIDLNAEISGWSRLELVEQSLRNQ